MQLTELLLAIREHYLEAYRAALEAYREQFSPGGPEVLLEMDREVAQVYRYYRMDLASGAVDPPDLTEVNPESHLVFEETQFTHIGMSVTVSPMVWNGVECEVEPALMDDTALQAWALRWIDPEEGASTGADGLGAYIHSVTPPETEGTVTRFTIDFGSAPVSCVMELLALVREYGASTVALHSRSMLEE